MQPNSDHYFLSTRLEKPFLLENVKIPPIENFLMENPDASIPKLRQMYSSEKIWACLKDKILDHLINKNKKVIRDLVQFCPELIPRIWLELKTVIISNPVKYAYLLKKIIENDDIDLNQLDGLKEVVLNNLALFRASIFDFSLKSGVNLKEIWYRKQAEILKNIDTYKIVISIIIRFGDQISHEIWQKLRTTLLKHPLKNKFLIKKFISKDINIATEIWENLKDKIHADLPKYYYIVASLCENHVDLIAKVHGKLKNTIVNYPKLQKNFLHIMSQNNNVTTITWQDIKQEINDNPSKSLTKSAALLFVDTDSTVAKEIWDMISNEILSEPIIYQEIIIRFFEKFPEYRQTIRQKIAEHSKEDYYKSKTETIDDILDEIRNKLALLKIPIPNETEIEKTLDGLSLPILKFLKNIINTSDIQGIINLFGKSRSISQFDKDGSELEVILFKNNFLLKHNILTESYKAWQEVYDAGIPCAPIIKTRANKNESEYTNVFSTFCGCVVSTIEDIAIDPEIIIQIKKQQRKILKSLSDTGIEHGHTHDNNFVIRLINKELLKDFLNEDGELEYRDGLNKRLQEIYSSGIGFSDNLCDYDENMMPVVSIIDFDRAKQTK